MVVSKTNDHIQIKIMIPNYSQVHPGPSSSKVPNWDIEDMDVLCAIKINIVSKCGTHVYQIPVTIEELRSFLGKTHLNNN